MRMSAPPSHRKPSVDLTISSTGPLCRSTEALNYCFPNRSASVLGRIGSDTGPAQTGHNRAVAIFPQSRPSRSVSGAFRFKAILALSALSRRPEDHRYDRSAGGDRAHSHALGVVRAAAATPTGAAGGSVSRLDIECRCGGEMAFEIPIRRVDRQKARPGLKVSVILQVLPIPG